MFCGVAGYMALTLLVESGVLGSFWAKGKSVLQQCWGGLRGIRHRRQGYAPLDEESPLGDDEVEDEDVKAERMALQTGAYCVSLMRLILKDGGGCMQTSVTGPSVWHHFS